MIFLDTEFDARRCGDVSKCLDAQLLQVGLLHIDNDTGNVLREKLINVIPERPVSPEVMEFHGIGEDGFTEDAMPIEKALVIIDEFMSNEPDNCAYVFGSQDITLIRTLAFKHNCPMRMVTKDISNLKTMITFVCKNKRWRLTDRDRLAQSKLYELALGRKPENVHNALGDCYAMYDIIKEYPVPRDLEINLGMLDAEYALFELVKNIESSVFQRVNFGKDIQWSFEEYPDDKDIVLCREVGLAFKLLIIPSYDRRGHYLQKTGLKTYYISESGELVVLRDCVIAGALFKRSEVSDENVLEEWFNKYVKL